MTATFQKELLDTSYNGFDNYETWNISLWVNNEEGLYKLALSCGDYETLVKVLYDEFGVTETKDGVKFADPLLNIVQLNSNIFDL